MDVKVNGERLGVDLKEQSAAWLLDTHQELIAAANDRGLKLPGLAGAAAVEGAQDSRETDREPGGVKKEILDQLPHAQKAYNETVDILNQGSEGSSDIPEIDEETLETELDQWLTDDRIAVIEAAKKANPDTDITLIAAPNVGVASDDLIKMHQQFGEMTGHRPTLWKHIKDLYDQYGSGRELTSSSGYSKVNFSLDVFNDRLSNADNKQMLEDAAELEGNKVQLRTPSPLDAEVYRRTLFARGDASNGRAARKTFIAHFDLPDHLMPVSWSQKSKVVPLSAIMSDGSLSVGWSPPRDDEGAQRIFLK